VNRGEQRGVRDAETYFFALHISGPSEGALARWSVPAKKRITSGLRPIGGRHAGEKTKTPFAAQIAQPCPLRSGHPAERIGQAGRKLQKINTISKKFDSGPWGFFRKDERCWRLKNPPPLVPNSLITSCEATGPLCDYLFA